MLDAVRSIVKTSGPAGLMQGFSASALRDAPYAGLFVMSYEFIKTSASEICMVLYTIYRMLTPPSQLLYIIPRRGLRMALCSACQVGVIWFIDEDDVLIA